MDGNCFCGIPRTNSWSLLFNIFLSDLFFTVNSTDIPNYAYDNTLYATNSDIGSLIIPLEEVLRSLLTWFDNKLMKSNADKCHLLVSSNEKVAIKIGYHKIANTKREKFLDAHLDGELSFDYHISEINLFASNAPFLYPLKTSENLKGF